MYHKFNTLNKTYYISTVTFKIFAREYFFCLTKIKLQLIKSSAYLKILIIIIEIKFIFLQ